MEKFLGRDPKRCEMRRWRHAGPKLRDCNAGSMLGIPTRRTLYMERPSPLYERECSYPHAPLLCVATRVAWVAIPSPSSSLKVHLPLGHV